MSDIISKEDVNYIAKLSKLEFNDAEVDQFATDLNSILDYVKKLDELDTSDVEPTSHVLSIHNAVREDVTKPSLTSEKALRNAPSGVNGHFEVPRVIES